MKALVTGATDLIGSYVAVRLAQAGHEVVAIPASLAKASALGAIKGISIAEADLSTPNALLPLLEGCDALIHVALGEGGSGPDILAIDTASSVALFEAARLAGVGQVIYTSSTTANGELEALNSEERQLRPVDLFGATKAATEMFARAYAFSGGPRMHIVRPGYIFGKPVVEGTDAEVDQRFVQICRSIKQGLPIRLIKHDGTQFIHARDVAEVYLALLAHPENFSIHYALANEWVSWAKIAEMAMEEAGKRVAVKLEDCSYSPVPYLFDVRKLEVDFELSFVNEQELREHIRWALSLA